MLFQTLDDKGECVGIYYDGELVFDLDDFPDDLTRSWTYSSYLDGYRGVDYADLYAQGKTLDEVCPEHLEYEWEALRLQRLAFIRSLRISKVDIKSNCLYDILPPWFLRRYNAMKNEITNHVIETFSKPPNYRNLYEVRKMLTEIKNDKLNIDTSSLVGTDPQTLSTIRKVRNSSKSVVYNQFGTITGRLTTKPKTFPILTLRKEDRTIIKPTNDLFVELDFNAAEIRVLLSLLGEDQPEEDVHEYNAKHVFDDISRDEAKRTFFAWLYGSHSPALAKYKSVLRKRYNKSKLTRKFYDGYSVLTPYSRNIPASDHLALNYLIQSTTADLTLEQATKLRKMLVGHKSKIAFIIHDSVVIDLDIEDKELLTTLAQEFGNTRFGKFRVNSEIGKNFGEMKKAKQFG